MVLITMIGSDACRRADIIADLLGLFIPLGTGAGGILAFAVVAGERAIDYCELCVR